MSGFSISTAVTLLGALLILRLAYSFATFLYINLRASSLSRYRHTNAYAIITGSSDGIGLGFAHELLSRGFNVILHGRNESKLRGIQSNLTSQYPGRDVQYYVADAARTGKEGWTEFDALRTRFQDLPISVLINNIGGMVGVEPIFELLENRTTSQVEHILALNSIYPTQMTRALLPVLKRNSPSLIINISSAASALPGAFNDVYSGSKAYLVHWSHSLNCEMRAMKQNVEVLLVDVGSTLTQGNPLSTSTGLFTPSPRDMAKSALQKVGCGEWNVFGYWPHALQRNILYWLPEPLMELAAIAVSNYIKEEQDKKTKKGK